jgi:hydroxyacylglutathione hydrolase
VVDEWLRPGSVIQLGGRELLVLHTPGHTTDSISLLDTGHGMLFTGDFIYLGPLYAFLPNSGMGDYLQSAESVLAVTPVTTDLYGAHREGPPGAPKLGRSDVLDLSTLLHTIENGTAKAGGVYPVEYEVNDRVQLLTEPRWWQDWTTVDYEALATPVADPIP